MALGFLWRAPGRVGQFGTFPFPELHRQRPRSPRSRSHARHRGVVDLVRNGSDPIDVPEPIIAGVKAREDENGYVLLGNNLGLARGDRFRIGGGAFFDQIAVFEAKRDEDRVIALLSLLGRQVTVQVPIGYVAPIS